MIKPSGAPEVSAALGLATPYQGYFLGSFYAVSPKDIRLAPSCGDDCQITNPIISLLLDFFPVPISHVEYALLFGLWSCIIVILEPGILALIALAALFAGAINALAGGGSFLTLPALVFTGVPPVAANATGTAALLPGYLASAWAYRDLMKAPPGMTVLAVVLIGAVGGAAGALLLLATSNEAFRVIIPWLLLFATLLFAFGPRLQVWTQARSRGRGGLLGRVSVFLVSGYGGYFNGGMGIVMLAAFRVLGVQDLNTANALKNLLSAVLTLIAVLIYALGGVIQWAQALPMAVAATIGGYAGVSLARALPQAVLRNAIIIAGIITTAIFFWDLR